MIDKQKRQHQHEQQQKQQPQHQHQHVYRSLILKGSAIYVTILMFA
jgi:hypothetical protein